jgi:predicted lysophospholipase L1 biosynthesis ABC-type transport system permease subunit
MRGLIGHHHSEQPEMPTVRAATRDGSPWHRRGVLVSLAAVILAVAFVAAAWLESGSLIVVAIALPAGVALILRTVSMRVRHQAEILALYRALGRTQRSLGRTVLIRSSWVGALGSFLGTAIALLLATPGGFKAESLAAVPISMGMGIAVTIATAMVATWRVLRQPTPETLRHKAPEAPAANALAIGGLVVIVAGIAAVVSHPGGHLSNVDKTVSLVGVLLIWLGVLLAAPLLAMSVLRPIAWILGVYGGPKFRLAVREATRHPRRTAATASSLITGVCLVCAFAASGLLLGLVLAVAVFDVARTFLLSGMERGHDIGVMRSVGASRPFIMRTVTRENLVIGLCGGILGVVAGLAIGGAVQHIMLSRSIRDVSLPIPALVLMLGTLAAIGTFALWWPTSRAASAELTHHSPRE